MQLGMDVTLMESTEDEQPKAEDIFLELMPLPGTDRDLAEAKREAIVSTHSPVHQMH